LNDIIKFNPDELKLTKKDIIEIMDSIEDRWKQDKLRNSQFIISLEAMKLGIRLMKESTITQLWIEIINGFNALLYENAMTKAKGENESWANTLEKVKKRIREDAGARVITD